MGRPCCLCSFHILIYEGFPYLITQDQPRDVRRPSGRVALHQHRQDLGQGRDPVHRGAGRNPETDHGDQEHRRSGHLKDPIGTNHLDYKWALVVV